MKHPHFTMSKFMSSEDLWKAQAKYYHIMCCRMEELMEKCVEDDGIASTIDEMEEFLDKERVQTDGSDI